MDARIKKLWIEALRSGKYKQGRSYLRVGDEYCCLGVLCEVAVKEGVIPLPEVAFEIYKYNGAEKYLPASVVRFAKLDNANPLVGPGDTRTLAGANDEGSTFVSIASLIETYL